MKTRPRLIIYAALILSFLVFICILLGPLRKKAVPVHVKARAKGVIAIVIDDWGYTLGNLETAGEIKYPITCAVLPNLKNTGQAASRLQAMGFEIILHLPMQPKEGYRLEQDTITLSMDERQILAILDKDLKSVLFAKGISNHMGSRITEDPRIISLVLKEARKRNLYFLDSYVTSASVCPLLAKEIKTRFAKRDVFLDNRDEPEYIKSQLIRLKDLAAKNGLAVGIGHDRRNTISVLKEMIPRMAKEGYRFVFVSEIAR
jgi:polysaccharide deacetylase 2 family uncharacterized protein YibQ